MQINNKMRLMFLVFLISLFLAPFLTSSQFTYLDTLGNQSKISKNNLLLAEECFNQLKSRNIPSIRANESLEQALQIYLSQLYFERKGSSSNYNLSNKYSLEVCQIRDLAFKAQDELTLFNSSWQESSERFDLTPISNLYSEIIKSFEQERFEETTSLIDKGYTELSDFESSQTMINLFYENTKKNILQFFFYNWKKMVISFFIFLILFFILKKPFLVWKLNKNLKDIETRKLSVNNLVKKSQDNYFKKKNISELEYTTKINTFGKIRRELDKQSSITKEKLHKLTHKIS